MKCNPELMRLILWKSSRFSLLLFLLLAFPYPSVADIYRYLDNSGTVCMTDNLKSVPLKYRNRMTVVKADKKKPSTVQQSDVQQETAQAEALIEPIPEPSNRSKFVKTFLILVGIVIVWFLIGRVAEIIGIQRFTPLFVLALLLIGGVFLYRLYIQQLTDVYQKLRSNSLNVKKNVETREQKTDIILQRLDAQDGMPALKPSP